MACSRFAQVPGSKGNATSPAVPNLPSSARTATALEGALLDVRRTESVRSKLLWGDTRWSSDQPGSLSQESAWLSLFPAGFTECIRLDPVQEWELEHSLAQGQPIGKVRLPGRDHVVLIVDHTTGLVRFRGGPAPDPSAPEAELACSRVSWPRDICTRRTGLPPWLVRIFLLERLPDGPGHAPRMVGIGRASIDYTGVLDFRPWGTPPFSVATGGEAYLVTALGPEGDLWRWFQTSSPGH